MGILFLITTLNINNKFADSINGIIYLITLILLFDIIPIEISNFWDKVTLGPDIFEWMWGFIPTISMWTLFKLTYEFTFRIFIPCVGFYFGITYCVIDIWKNKN